MEWQISFLEAEQVVVVETWGPLDDTSSLEMARAAVAAVRERLWRRILVDHRRITALTLSTVDIYGRPKELREIGVGPEIRIAELVRAAYAKHFDFLETVSANRGIRMAVFLDRALAVAWLANE